MAKPIDFKLITDFAQLGQRDVKGLLALSFYLLEQLIEVLDLKDVDRIILYLDDTDDTRMVGYSGQIMKGSAYLPNLEDMEDSELPQEPPELETWELREMLKADIFKSIYRLLG